MEAGLIEYWKKWSPGKVLDMDLCKLANNEPHTDENVKPIKLIELSSAFFVLGLGYALATMAFMCEKVANFLINFFCKGK